MHLYKNNVYRKTTATTTNTALYPSAVLLSLPCKKLTSALESSWTTSRYYINHYNKKIAFHEAKPSSLAGKRNLRLIRNWANLKKKNKSSIEILIFIFVLRHSRNEYEEIVNQSWGKLNSLKSNVSKIKIFHATSSRNFLQQAQILCAHCHWYMFVDDATFVFLENLPVVLSSYDPHDVRLFMYPDLIESIFDDAQQANGTIISKAALDLLMKVKPARSSFVFNITTVFKNLLNFPNASVEILPGLNPTHPDKIVEILMSGNFSFRNCCANLHLFALPLAYSNIQSFALMIAYYHRFYPPYDWTNTLHSIWIRGKMTEKVRQGLASCKRVNEKSFELRMWNETMLTKLLPAGLLRKFPKFTTDFKVRLKLSDVARLIILYFYGGIYLDADTDCLRPLDQLDYQKYECFSARESDRNNHLYANGAIGSARKSYCGLIHLLKLFELLDERIFHFAPWIATGPAFITSTYKLHATNAWHVYDSVTFYPVNNQDYKRKMVTKSVATKYGICKGSYTIHWWKAHE